MKTLVFTFIGILIIQSSYGQDISRHQADSLIHLLQKTNNNANRINALLKLADFNIFKPGSFKADLDSAASFIDQARRINEKLKSRAYLGYILLMESCLYDEHAQKDLGLATRLADSAIQALERIENKTLLFRAYLEKWGNYYANTPSQATVRKSLEDKMTALLKSNSNSLTTTISGNELWFLYHDRRIPEGSTNIWMLETMSKDFRKTHDKIRELSDRKELADIHLRQGKIVQAQNELLKIIKEYRQINYPHMCFTYDLLSGAYWADRNYSKALDYGLQTIKSLKFAKDSVCFPAFCYRLYDIYSRLENWTECIKWQKKSLDFEIAHGNTTSVFDAVRGISAILIKEGKAKEALAFVLKERKLYTPANLSEKKKLASSLLWCYLALGEYAIAEKYANEIKYFANIQRINGEKTLEYFDDVALQKFYLGTKKFHLASIYLNKLIKEWPTIHATQDYVYIGLFKVDSAAGNYPKAIRDLRRAQQIHDSTFDIAKNKQIEELRIKYETEEKEKDIKLLQSREKIQRIGLQHAESTKNWIIGGSLMLLLLLGIIYNRYRLKIRTNELITHKNELLQHVLAEKEWLLKEVHHRVKNNLHTVICLLESQAAYLENDALKAIENSQNRIYAMSLIHQKLYQSEDIKTIDMDVYVPELIRYLQDGLGSENRISFQLDIEKIKLGASQAIPLALIINEAVTNSIKYAFTDMNGRIMISLHTEGNQNIMILADNGKGIHPDILNRPSSSLGLKLIDGLSEDIGAELTIENKNGTRIIVVFDIDPLNDARTLTTPAFERDIVV